MMRLLRLITLRSLSTRRLRSFLTLFGIVLGVAAMFSINFVNRSAYDSITRLFEGTSGKVDLEIRNVANVGGLSMDALDVVASVEGVDMAFPILEVIVALPKDIGDEIDFGFFGVGFKGILLYGIDPINDRFIRDYTIVSGRFPRSDIEAMEIVLVEDYAVEQEIIVGETVEFVTSFGIKELTVVGLIAKEGPGQTNMGKFGVIDLNVAQSLTQRPDEIDRIDILAIDNPDPAFLESLKNRLSERLGEAYNVGYPADQGEQMSQMLSGYQISLNFMAGIALFVGAFLIYNSLSMTVAERTRELGLLRCVGMTRNQITIQVIVEGIMLGILGAIVGVGLGLLLSFQLTSLMSEILGQPLEIGSIPFDILIFSLSIGIMVTLLSALLPAIQAGKVSPMEVLRLRSKDQDGWITHHGWLIGAVLLIFSTGILVWNPFPFDVQFRLGSLTVFTLFLGATLLIPASIRMWQWISRYPIRLLFGNLGVLGSRNIERSKKRTMLTGAALMVGVSMIVSTQGITKAFTQDLFEWIDAYMGSDVFIAGEIPLNLDLKDGLESLDSVETASPIRMIEATWIIDDQTETITLMGIDPTSYVKVARFVYTDNTIDETQAINDLTLGNRVFVSGVIREKYGIEPGDDISLRTREGDKTFRVVASVIDFTNQGMVMTVNLDDIQQYYGVNDADYFYVNVDDRFEIEQAVTQIKDAYQKEYQLIIESNAALKARANDLLRQAFSMFDVLGILAVVVAALGVLNTISMSVIERTREIGMLRSMGMTRLQTIRMILAEAGLLGIIGGMLGLAFGLLLTWILLMAMGVMSGYALKFEIPVDALWISVVVAFVTSLLAALIPAFKAAKTPMLKAIQYE